MFIEKLRKNNTTLVKITNKKITEDPRILKYIKLFLIKKEIEVMSSSFFNECIERGDKERIDRDMFVFILDSTDINESFYSNVFELSDYKMEHKKNRYGSLYEPYNDLNFIDPYFMELAGFTKDFNSLKSNESNFEMLELNYKK